MFITCQFSLLTVACYSSNLGTPTLNQKEPRTAATITTNCRVNGIDTSNFDVNDPVTFFQSLDSSCKIILSEVCILGKLISVVPATKLMQLVSDLFQPYEGNYVLVGNNWRFQTKLSNGSEKKQTGSSFLANFQGMMFLKGVVFLQSRHKLWHCEQY